MERSCSSERMPWQQTGEPRCPRAEVQEGEGRTTSQESELMRCIKGWMETKSCFRSKTNPGCQQENVNGHSHTSRAFESSTRRRSGCHCAAATLHPSSSTTLALTSSMVLFEVHGVEKHILGVYYANPSPGCGGCSERRPFAPECIYICIYLCTV